MGLTSKTLYNISVSWSLEETVIAVDEWLKRMLAHGVNEQGL